MRFPNSLALLCAALALSGCGVSRKVGHVFGAGGPPPASQPIGAYGGGGDASGARYDAVGMAGWYSSPMGQQAVTAAHSSLPIGAFVEVTELNTGRTILVAITDRMGRTDKIMGLSRAALMQLGATGPAPMPVRVRRVRPSDDEAAALQQGRAVALRMNVGGAELDQLRGRMGGGAPVQLGSSDAWNVQPMQAMPTSPIQNGGQGAGYGYPGQTQPQPYQQMPQSYQQVPQATLQPPQGWQQQPQVQVQQSQPQAQMPAAGAGYGYPGVNLQPGRQLPALAAPAATAGTSYVLVAIAYEAGAAQQIASRTGGQIVPLGRLFRVRLGPYDPATAARARDAAIAAGYRDARILDPE